MPVMEGKAALFKRFAGVDAWPVCLDTQDTEEIIRTVQIIAPAYGGINLEDIAAPRCFEIEARLREMLDIPVFHDDQHGTAIVRARRAAQRAARGRQAARRLQGRRVRGGRRGLGDHPAAAPRTGRARCWRSTSTASCTRGRPGMDPNLVSIAAQTNPAGVVGLARRRARRRRRLHRRLRAEPVRRRRARHDGVGRDRVRAGQPRSRGRPDGGDAARRRRGDRPVGLPEPDQQRARVPRRVPGPARRARRATSPTRCCSPRRPRSPTSSQEPNPSFIVPSVFDAAVAPAVAEAVRTAV